MALKYETTFVALLLLLMRFHGNVAAQNNAKLAASFIFGDSLVDAGNNNYLSTLSKANVPPNGIDFKASGGNPTGRFTNGRTIADIVGNIFFSVTTFSFIYIPFDFYFLIGFLTFLGEELGQASYAVPYLAPNTTGKTILNGVNYASGGGGILNATGSLFVSIFVIGMY